MNYGLSLSRAEPSAPPLDTELVKSQLRITHDAFDELISTLHIPGAVSWAEGETKRAIALRPCRWVLSQFPRSPIYLPAGKTDSVTSIRYVVDGQTVTLRGPSSGSPIGTDYQEDLSSDAGGILMPPPGDLWPSADRDVPAPVVIDFVAGWPSDRIPADLKLGMMWYIAEALDAVGGADIGPHMDFSLKDKMISGWVLR